jgi:putative spermidine/putrescine transport system ATP-binding protein
MTRFVADFVGSSNVLSPALAKAAGGPSKWASLRPEKIGILRGKEKAPATSHHAAVSVRAVHYQGAVTRLNTVTASGDPINVSAGSNLGHFAEGETLILHWQPEALHVMAGEA